MYHNYESCKKSNNIFPSTSTSSKLEFLYYSIRAGIQYSMHRAPIFKIHAWSWYTSEWYAHSAMSNTDSTQLLNSTPSKILYLSNYNMVNLVLKELTKFRHYHKTWLMSWVCKKTIQNRQRNVHQKMNYYVCIWFLVLFILWCLSM